MRILRFMKEIKITVEIPTYDGGTEKMTIEKTFKAIDEESIELVLIETLEEIANYNSYDNYELVNTEFADVEYH